MFENTTFAQVVQFIEICAGIATAVAVLYAIKTYNSSKEKNNLIYQKLFKMIF